MEHDLVVIRLHGPDRESIEEKTRGEWNHIVAPKDEELAGIAEMAREILTEGPDVYLNVNNHYEGSAPLTIRRLQDLL